MRSVGELPITQITGLSFNAATRSSLCSSGIRMQQMQLELAISAEKHMLIFTLADCYFIFFRLRRSFLLFRS